MNRRRSILQFKQNTQKLMQFCSCLNNEPHKASLQHNGSCMLWSGVYLCDQPRKFYLEELWLQIVNHISWAQVNALNLSLKYKELP